jgi:hypothetical protein
MAKDPYKALKARLKEKENIDDTVNFEGEPAGTVVDEVCKPRQRRRLPLTSRCPACICCLHLF